MAQQAGLPNPPDLKSLPADGGPRFNRLIFEKSPYLLQHAENPVDWYPWGDEAFSRAKREKKPIFLSIGYATCHWCHVMAHESFEDESVAKLLNRDFIAIKVDKEERPDIDDIYMTACMALNGHGGWPLTVLLAPDQRPFFAATYLPKTSRGGRMGMLEFLPRIVDYWQKDQEAVLKNATQLTDVIQQYNGTAAGEISAESLENTYRQLAGKFDPNYGGFGTAPKFPTAHHLLFLLRAGIHEWGDQANDMVSQTLLAMRAGGVFDHLGFGFHRYSTDQHWLLPHFEKMLYDQAMLAMAYLEAYCLTRDRRFARTAEEIFEYVLRDMTHEEGGFFSAEDADSEGEEGKFYVWTPDEINRVLGPDVGKAFAQVYQLEHEGNFREEASGHFTGANILHLPFDGATYPDDERPMESACQVLFAARKGRIHPLKDDKVLTDWNGLMIAAFSMGYRILGDDRYLQAGQRAADFLQKNLMRQNGELWKRFRDGEAGLPAHLDDYAFAAFGFLELYRASGATPYLQKTFDLVEIAINKFQDDKSGAFFQTAMDGEPLIARSMKAQDGAIPSGNSVMAYVLAMLGRLTGKYALEEQARAVIQAYAGQLNEQPQSSSFMMIALDFLESPSQEIVVVGSVDDSRTERFLSLAREGYHPNRLIVLKRPGDEALEALMPFVKDMTPRDDKPTAYICQNQTCEQPTNDVDKFRARLAKEN